MITALVKKILLCGVLLLRVSCLVSRAAACRVAAAIGQASAATKHRERLAEIQALRMKVRKISVLCDGEVQLVLVCLLVGDGGWLVTILPLPLPRRVFGPCFGGRVCFGGDIFHLERALFVGASRLFFLFLLLLALAMSAHVVFHAVIPTSRQPKKKHKKKQQTTNQKSGRSGGGHQFVPQQLRQDHPRYAPTQLRGVQTSGDHNTATHGMRRHRQSVCIRGWMPRWVVLFLCLFVFFVCLIVLLSCCCGC